MSATLNAIQRTLVRSYLNDALAEDAMVTAAYLRAEAMLGDALLRERLIFISPLLDVLRDPSQVALALCAALVPRGGDAFLTELQGTVLAELAAPLRYFLTTQQAEQGFLGAQQRWVRDAERWVNAPDICLMIRVAELQDALRRSAWNAFMARQQLLERVGIFVETLEPALAADSLGHEWCGYLRKTVADVIAKDRWTPESSAARRILG